MSRHTVHEWNMGEDGAPGKDRHMLVNEDAIQVHEDSPILHPSSRALFRFWEQMRAERSSPRRDELDLSRIKPLVPNLLIAAYEPKTASYRWRLAGTGICDIYRREVTGLDVLGGWDSFETNVATRFFSGVIHKLQPCLVRMRMMTDMSQVIGAEFIGMPLTAVDGRGIHIFGGLFPFRDVLSLGYSSITAIELSGARSIWTEHLPGSQMTGIGVSAAYRGLRVIPGGRG